MRKPMRVCAALLCCFVLCGCGDFSLGARNIEELLRAPRPTARQSAVQSALNTYLGETLQLKYPRTGRQTEPVIFADFDGDGSEEAAVLYTVESKGKNVHLAILEHDGDGWVISDEVRGLSTEVMQLESAGFWEDSVQLLVGYANSNLMDKYLEVYEYRDDTLYSVCKQPYQAYFSGDLDADGVRELAVASSPSGPGAMSLQMFVPGDSALELIQSLTLSEQFESCTAVMPTRSGLVTGLVVDGTTANGSASCVVRCGKAGLTLVPRDAADAAFQRSRRSGALSLLCPTDLSGRGTVFVPEVGARIQTLQSASRFYPVEWVDYLKDEPAVRYGIYDAQYHYFMRLPVAWRGKISITSISESDWQIVREDVSRLMCTVRIAPLNENSGIYYDAAHLAENKVLVHVADGCSQAEQALIYTGMRVLD